MKLEKCVCGNEPRIRTEKVCIGHGSCVNDYFVTCGCGLQTKKIDDWGKNAKECVEKITKLWNEIITAGR